MVISRLEEIKDLTINGESHKFLLLFHHKLENANFFTDYNDFLFSNTQNKFSIFGYFNDFFKIGTNFSFLFEYPEHDCHLFWHQEENPLKTEHNSKVNYDIKSQTCPNPCNFTGLTKFRYGNCFLDGSAFPDNLDYWYYAVGQTTNWDDDFQIPGFERDKSPIIKEVNLWIEIQDLSILNRLFPKITCNQRIFLPRSIVYCFSLFLIS